MSAKRFLSSIFQFKFTAVLAWSSLNFYQMSLACSKFTCTRIQLMSALCSVRLSLRAYESLGREITYNTVIRFTAAHDMPPQNAVNKQ